MSRHKIFAIASVLSLFGLGACNSTYEPGESIASSVAVYSFSIRSTNNALAGIDTVFFSVDLVNARIFNADSLPYGTKITSIVPSVKTLDGVSVCEFHVIRPGLADTVYNMISHPEDSINFSNGPVRLRIVSPDAAVERYYSVSINVHKMKGDSLEWAMSARKALPTELTSPVASGLAATEKGTAYCVTADASGAYSLAYTDAPYSGPWKFVTSPFAGITGGVRPGTLRAGESALYILDNQGSLYTSADGGKTWTATGRTYTDFFGELAGLPVGVSRDSGGDYVLPDPRTGEAKPLPAEDFPVSGASPAVRISFPMSAGEQLVLVGGRTASGALSADAWTFDGNSWLKVTNVPLPAGLEGMTLVPYTTFKGSYAWSADPFPSLLAFGGRDAEGVPSKTVYLTRDYGMTWHKADASIQLPEYFPAVSGMQGFVMNHMMNADAARAAGLDIFAPLSRATEPVTEWEVPYIYLAGGTTADGALNAYLWRGVINRLSFKPLI